jgi:asparagine synthase (glutamine-hydrolysing)
MSGIAGIYNLDGRPVDPALLHRMTDVIAHRGPDGINHWNSGPVGLGQCMLQTTPESLQEIQPLMDETGALCLAFDGRIDNREDLKADLEKRGARLRNDTDSELVLRAYGYWAEDFAEQIIGDFAFIIWDRAKRQLFCARDPLGIKPFYYYADHLKFLCGSELRQLFADPRLLREPNEAMIGEYLADRISDKTETLYKGIFRLPPAHNLIVRCDKVLTRRYWDIDPARETRYRTSGEYADHFRELFKNAVRCRLRSCGNVAAELSGGLDSSSVVAMVQSGSAGLNFETFSLVFPGLSCDESTYIQRMKEMWDIKSNVVYGDKGDQLGHNYSEDVRRYQDFPDYPNASRWRSLLTLAREKGFRVLLTGWGGDEWLSGSLYRYADLLRHFRLLELTRQARYDFAISDISRLASISRMFKHGVWPLLPYSLHTLVQAIAGKNSAPPWVNTRFAERIRLAERLRSRRSKSFSSFAQEDLYNDGAGGLMAHNFEMDDRFLSRFGLEHRHPLNDRRIVEFAMALPYDQLCRGDQSKFVVREAMHKYLPIEVRERRTKADFSYVIAKTLHAHKASFMNPLSIESMGWINRAELLYRYRRMTDLYRRGSSEYIQYIWPLWMVLAIELWFSTMFVEGKSN